MTSSEAPQLVFVVGAGRSGSTLLGKILDRHRDIASVPEFQFFKRIYSKRKKFHSDSDPAFVQYARTKLTDIITSEYRGQQSVTIDKASIQENIRHADNVRDVFLQVTEALAEDASVQAHTTPSDIFFLNQVFDLFPHAKVIHIMRDGREVVTSAAKRGWGYSKLDQISQWQESLRAIDMFKKKNGKYQKQFQEYTYQDLVQQPKATLTDIFNYLNIPVPDDSFFAFDGFKFSNTSFEDRKSEGLYHSTHFEEYFDTEEQKKIQWLLRHDLESHGFSTALGKPAPLLWLWNWYRRLKLRLYIKIHGLGYGHYYDAVRQIIK